MRTGEKSMTTYEFYRDVCGGHADEASFDSAVGAADTVIRAFLYPADPDGFCGSRADAFRRAVCLQVDHTLEDPGRMRVRSESLGDRSVTYETEDAGEIFVKGVSVSPQAVLILEVCGCLTRWV